MCTSRTASASDSAPAATSALYSPSECPATRDGRTSTAPPARAAPPTLVVRIAGWALRRERQLRLGPLEAQLRQRIAEHVVGLREHGARLGIGVVQRTAHADLLRALTREDEATMRSSTAHHLHRRGRPRQPAAERREQQMSPS